MYIVTKYDQGYVEGEGVESPLLTIVILNILTLELMSKTLN